MSEWQDIASAPRDGTEILVWTADGQFVGHWSGEYFACVADDAPFWQPNLPHDAAAPWCPATHWMPLPPAPQKQGRG